MRRIDEVACEMKRLYVRPDGRGKGIGTLLVQTLIDTAKNYGYKLMKLDTVPSMKDAIRLYTHFGFKETYPYRHNPIPGALFMELDLSQHQSKT
jgi:GNAT superfamily N-acetyltransferase